MCRCHQLHGPIDPGAPTGYLVESRAASTIMLQEACSVPDPGTQDAQRRSAPFILYLLGGGVLPAAAWVSFLPPVQATPSDIIQCPLLFFSRNTPKLYTPNQPTHPKSVCQYLSKSKLSSVTVDRFPTVRPEWKGSDKIFKPLNLTSTPHHDDMVNYAAFPPSGGLAPAVPTASTYCPPPTQHEARHFPAPVR